MDRELMYLRVFRIKHKTRVIDQGIKRIMGFENNGNHVKALH